MVKPVHQDIVHLRQYFEYSCDQYPTHTALVCDDVSLTYVELENRANQLANYLITKGIGSHSSVGIFLERSLESYISILAILKTGAAYVPIDVDFPDERVNHILSDMTFQLVITSTIQSARSGIQFPERLIPQTLWKELLRQPITRPPLMNCDKNQLCYVIYTSGSTGKPKGVEITQGSICHYVAVASDFYGMTAKDKVYQGFSLSFDASLEELWMAFANGGTLVACLSKDIRSGIGLIDFLRHHQVTVFSTVPTLLATLQGELMHLRLLISGGEACTASLLKRWHRPGLRIINTYGPTEATVVATGTDCHSDRPVSIGRPLPGYSVVILDEHQQPVPEGQPGELCIGGPALARGYVNLPDMTAQKFIAHPNDPTQRLYRTGDLAAVNPEGDLQFLGRVDSQIKLRGFRIELGEIEEILMEYPGVSQAVASLHPSDNSTLVAWLLKDESVPFNMETFKNFLNKHLPQYMIPAQFEFVTSFPLLASGKVNRKALPEPSTQYQSEDAAPPETSMEKRMTQVFEQELGRQNISIDADFFYDLGGHSLLAARIVSNLRRVEGLQSLSILDLYNQPTIRRLAGRFETGCVPPKTDQKKERNSTGRVAHALCATGQFFGCLFQYAINSWQLLTVVLCYHHVAKDGAEPLEIVLVCLALFLGLPLASMLVTILAKWILVGRVKPGKYKLWGWFYLRWWLVQRLQQNVFCPKHLPASPLMNLYFRLLGAKIGKNCFIGTASAAVHDCISIGDNSSIGYDSRLISYIVEDGWLNIGTITIGKNCFVGARTVLGINTVIEDHAVLDDMSMLPQNTVIPTGQFFVGSPATASAAPLDHVTRRFKEPENGSVRKTILYGLLHYFSIVFIMLVHYGCYYPALLLVTAFYEQSHYLLATLIGMPVGALLYLSLHYICIIVCKKLLLNKVTPGVYSIKSLYYLRQWLVVKMLDDDAVYVMADSLYMPRFMRLVGANLGHHVEMGEAPHVIPDLITIHDEGFSASSVAFAWPNIFQGKISFAPVKVGKRGFLGNVSFLPVGAHVGNGGLLGCMSITPPDNRAADDDTSWLGSPAVFLPKREMATGFSDQEKFSPSRRTYNIRLLIELVRIMAPATLTLFAFFNLLSILTLLLTNCSLFTTILVLPLAEMLIITGIVGFIIALKWLILGRLKPASKPIWDIFIRKLDLIEYLYSYFINNNFTNVILGTPFVSVLFRCLGAKIGKQVFIDTAQFAEFDLISIADNTCINAETLIDTHLYEDRVFKMSTIEIQENCNIGIGSIILYNTVMEKNSTLGNLSLLMKGETLPAGTSWQGAPAQPMQTAQIIHAEINPGPLAANDSLLVNNA